MLSPFQTQDVILFLNLQRQSIPSKQPASRFSLSPGMWAASLQGRTPIVCSVVMLLIESMYLLHLGWGLEVFVNPSGEFSMW